MIAMLILGAIGLVVFGGPVGLLAGIIGIPIDMMFWPADYPGTKYGIGGDFDG